MEIPVHSCLEAVYCSRLGYEGSVELFLLWRELDRQQKPLTREWLT
jgi:hypothetical protein